MKKILYLTLAVIILASCKKSKKEEIVTINSLIGTWQEQLSPVSSARSNGYIFRQDSTYTMVAGDFVGTVHGTFSAHAAGSGVRILDVTFSRAGGTTPPFTIELKTHNQMIISSGGTMGITYVRVQ
ncbi:hypothetical protein GFS24_21740 [Chitinophaga sp. SYP-B3965]|uniref:hypothetical protein n=1 Tax=Chitinophaga sp. SYP-B3965 TaxID=2663120 RepID=UPI0012997A9E|nr:hypothetical protein [Chitinophaga sp. SYP-B3965]MRG47761.1 hypothetical protein [Chitinophaga sp. SYP-B3965]